jgi:serine/threonine-protein kinase RsbT
MVSRELDEILGVLAEHISLITARGLVRLALSRTGIRERDVNARTRPALLPHVLDALYLYLEGEDRMRCAARLEALLLQHSTPPGPRRVELKTVQGIVEARGEARDLARQTGFTESDQVRIATAVSEVARNAVLYAGGGWAEIAPYRGKKSGVSVLVTDEGPGIANLEEILAGRYESKTGMGLGLQSCHRLMDRVDIDTGEHGTRILMTKEMP